MSMHTHTHTHTHVLSRKYGSHNYVYLAELYLVEVKYTAREGNGTPLQYSCLENPMDGGAWRAAVHGVARSWTRLSDFRRMQWHPTPVLLPGNSHRRRSLVGCSPWGREESDTTEQLHFHFSLSCIGEGNGNPLQRSCLENPKDGGAC